MALAPFSQYLRSLNGGCQLDEATFPGMGGKEEDAPVADVGGSMAIGRDSRRVLAGERRCAKLLIYLPCPAIDHHDRRDVAEAEHNIPVG